MDRIADFLFEAKTLKELPGAGYPFLGSGGESVAEHSFMTAIIAFTLSRMISVDIDGAKMAARGFCHHIFLAAFISKERINDNHGKNYEQTWN